MAHDKNTNSIGLQTLFRLHFWFWNTTDQSCTSAWQIPRGCHAYLNRLRTISLAIEHSFWSLAVDQRVVFPFHLINHAIDLLDYNRLFEPIPSCCVRFHTRPYLDASNGSARTHTDQTTYKWHCPCSSRALAGLLLWSRIWRRWSEHQAIESAPRLFGKGYSSARTDWCKENFCTVHSTTVAGLFLA